ncbi:MAG: S-methyl-5'-thioinosine phosphorylase [Gammaproteobacteria bacterium]|nr:S-methyl-5'-thioinosine phosphorylase [Gammaproteobacteria bacterium]
MDKLAIIGGTGLDSLGILKVEKREVINTPYGEPSGPIARGSLFGKELLFLPRHGYGHNRAPHNINYRANIWALREMGADNVLAIAAVGGIRDDMPPARLVVPNQIIDYTWGRAGTYYDGGASDVRHIDFSHPYSEKMRQRLIKAACAANVTIIDGGTYGATQGPRLETAAEINRMERDGCHLVGMTGMPEAALARELGICYACCAVVANWAAGKTSDEITFAEIEDNLKLGMTQLVDMLEQLMA